MWLILVEDIGVRNGVMGYDDGIWQALGIQDLMGEGEWKIVKVSDWLNPPFEVRELALYREERERFLLTD